MLKLKPDTEVARHKSEAEIERISITSKSGIIN
jgi:hypothetical protein